MEALLEILLEFVLEFLLQVVLEVLFELGLHALADPLRRKPGPLVAAVGYVAVGAALGALSLWLFPSSIVQDRMLRWVNLVVTPVFAGLAMVGIGVWRRRHEQLELRINRFSYGFLLAFSLAFVRFTWAH